MVGFTRREVEPDGARTHAMAAGAIRLDLSTGEANHSAQALYESLGFVRETDFRHYSLPLPPA